MDELLKTVLLQLLCGCGGFIIGWGVRVMYMESKKDELRDGVPLFEKGGR